MLVTIQCNAHEEEFLVTLQISTSSKDHRTKYAWKLRKDEIMEHQNNKLLIAVPKDLYLHGNHDIAYNRWFG